MKQGFTVTHAIRVVLAIGWSDFVLKYRGSILGYCWSLLGPLVKFGVILLIFGPYVEGQIPHYRLYLFLGIILWEHFATTIAGCMSMLHEKSSIIQQLSFPRILLICAVGWTNLIIFFTHLVVFGCFCMMLGVHWTWSALGIAIVMIEMTMLALGIGMILAAYSLKYRDIPHLWNVLSQILFWLTPVMYAPSPSGTPGLSGSLGVLESMSRGSYTHALRLMIDAQPLSMILHDARRFLLYPELWGTPTLVHSITLFLILLVIFGSGGLIFHRRQRYFLQEY